MINEAHEHINARCYWALCYILPCHLSTYISKQMILYRKQMSHWYHTEIWPACQHHDEANVQLMADMYYINFHIDILMGVISIIHCWKPGIYHNMWIKYCNISALKWVSLFIHSCPYTLVTLCDRFMEVRVDVNRLQWVRLSLWCSYMQLISCWRGN